MVIGLRKADWEDLERLLEWRNEPSTIPWMGATRALTFEEHRSWFEKALQDPECLLFIVEADSMPVGQLRYQKSVVTGNGVAKVSINLTYSAHGKGIASLAFKKGSEFVRTEGFANTVFAYVQLDNIGSIKAMEKAGFQRGATKEVHHIPHLIMIDGALL